MLINHLIPIEFKERRRDDKVTKEALKVFEEFDKEFEEFVKEFKEFGKKLELAEKESEERLNKLIKKL